MSKLTRYLFRQNWRPLLPRGYHALPQRSRAATWDESRLIARRLARTPDEAAHMIAHYGTPAQVLARVRAPRRKRPPVLRRAWRLIRLCFP